MKLVVITLLFLISFSGCIGIGDNDASKNKAVDTPVDPSKTTVSSPPAQPDTEAFTTIPIVTTTVIGPNSIVPDSNTTTTPIPPVNPNATTTEEPTTTTPTPSQNTTITPPTTTKTTTAAPPTPTTTSPPAPPSPTPNPNSTTIAPPTPAPPGPTPNPNTTTIAPPTPSNITTTVPPPSTTTKRPTPIPCRRFDGPSFIGGIVLAVGLMAISVVAYKFYKARTDRNYHTL